MKWGGLRESRYASKTPGQKYWQHEQSRVHYTIQNESEGCCWWSYEPGSQGLSGLQLEIGARRAPNMLCYVEHVPMTCKYLQWPFSVWCFFKVWRVWFRRQPDHIDPVWQVVEAGKGDRRVERDHHWHRHRLQEDQQRLHLAEFQPVSGVPWRVDKQKGLEDTRGGFPANANHPNLNCGESCSGCLIHWLEIAHPTDFIF